MKMYDQLRTFTSKPAYIIFATELFLHSLKTSNLPKIYPRFAMVFQKLWNSVQIVNCSLSTCTESEISFNLKNCWKKYII